MKPDWQFSRVISDGWKLTLSHKKLWLLGVALAVFASGSSCNSRNTFRQDKEEESGSQEQVLGAFENNSLWGSVLGENVELENETLKAENAQKGEWEQIKDGATQDLLALGLLAAMLVGIMMVSWVLYTVAHAWFVGALIEGVAMADLKKEVYLEGASLLGWQKVKALLWVMYVPVLKVLSLMLVGVAVGVVVAIVGGANVLAIVILLLVVAIGVVKLILITFAQTWAYRFLIEKSKSNSEAFERGKAEIKGRIWKMWVLKLFHGVLWLLTSVILVLPLFVVVVGAIWFSDDNLSAWIGAGMVALLVLISLWPLANGILRVFEFATWHYAFKAISGRENE